MNQCRIADVPESCGPGLGVEGHDTIVGGTQTDSIFGGNGNDSLSGNGQPDTLSGEAGADTLDGGPDGDSLSGGAGTEIDWLSYAGALSGVTVDLASGRSFGLVGGGAATRWQGLRLFLAVVLTIVLAAMSEMKRWMAALARIGLPTLPPATPSPSTLVRAAVQEHMVQIA